VLADDFLPVYDVSDEIATVVDADPQTVWKALMNADLLEVGKRVPLAGVSPGRVAGSCSANDRARRSDSGWSASSGGR
jgi:hypothetical protein